MNKSQMLKKLEAGLNHLLITMLAPADRASIRLAVKLFIVDHASKLSAVELAARFSTMEKGLRCFFDYLESDRLPTGMTVR
jgi:hypothetical protein